MDGKSQRNSRNARASMKSQNSHHLPKSVRGVPKKSESIVRKKTDSRSRNKMDALEIGVLWNKTILQALVSEHKTVFGISDHVMTNKVPSSFTLMVGQQVIGFDKFDYGTKFTEFLPKNLSHWTNAATSESNRCFFVSLGILTGINAYTLQAAMRHRVKYIDEQITKGNITESECQYSYKEFSGRLKTYNATIDAQILKYIWPIEFDKFRIWIVSSCGDKENKTYTRLCYTSNDARERRDVIIHHCVESEHFTILEIKDKVKFPNMDTVNNAIDEEMRNECSVEKDDEKRTRTFSNLQLVTPVDYAKFSISEDYASVLNLNHPIGLKDLQGPAVNVTESPLHGRVSPPPPNPPHVEIPNLYPKTIKVNESSVSDGTTVNSSSNTAISGSENNGSNSTPVAFDNPESSLSDSFGDNTTVDTSTITSLTIPKFNDRQSVILMRLYKKKWKDGNTKYSSLIGTDKRFMRLDCIRWIQHQVNQYYFKDFQGDAASAINDLDILQSFFRVFDLMSCNDCGISLPLSHRELSRANYSSPLSVSVHSREKAVVLEVINSLGLSDSLATCRNAVFGKAKWRQNILYDNLVSEFNFWRLLQKCGVDRPYSIQSKQTDQQVGSFTQPQRSILNKLIQDKYPPYTEGMKKFLFGNDISEIRSIVKSMLHALLCEIKADWRLFTKFELFQLNHVACLMPGIEIFGVHEKGEYFNDVGIEVDPDVVFESSVIGTITDREIEIVTEAANVIAGMNPSERPQNVSDAAFFLLKEDKWRRGISYFKFINKRLMKTLLSGGDRRKSLPRILEEDKSKNQRSTGRNKATCGEGSESKQLVGNTSKIEKAKTDKTQNNKEKENDNNKKKENSNNNNNNNNKKKKGKQKNEKKGNDKNKEKKNSNKKNEKWEKKGNEMYESDSTGVLSDVSRDKDESFDSSRIEMDGLNNSFTSSKSESPLDMNVGSNRRRKRKLKLTKTEQSPSKSIKGNSTSSQQSKEVDLSTSYMSMVSASEDSRIAKTNDPPQLPKQSFTDHTDMKVSRPLHSKSSSKDAVVSLGNGSTDQVSKSKNSPGQLRKRKQKLKNTEQSPSKSMKGNSTSSQQTREVDLSTSFRSTISASEDSRIAKTNDPPQLPKQSFTDHTDMKVSHPLHGKSSSKDADISLASGSTDQVSKSKNKSYPFSRPGWMNQTLNDKRTKDSMKSSSALSSTNHNTGRKQQSNISSKTSKPSNNQSPKIKSTDNNTLSEHEPRPGRSPSHDIDSNSVMDYYQEDLSDNRAVEVNGNSGRIPERNDDFEIERPSSESFAFCLQLSESIQIPLGGEICSLTTTLETIYNDRKYIVTGNPEIRSLDNLDILTAPFNDVVISSQLNNGFAVIGQFIIPLISGTKIGSKTKHRFMAICIVPKDPFVVLLEVQFGTKSPTRALYSMLNDKSINKIKVQLGEGKRVDVLQLVSLRKRDEKGFLLVANADDVNTVFRNGLAITKRLSSAKPPSIHPRSHQSILFNSECIAVMKADDIYVAEKLGYKIPGDQQARTGIRRGGAKFQDASSLHFSSLPRYDMANLRNIVIANIETTGHRKLTALEFAEKYEKVMQELKLSDAQKNALAALLCQDWQWRIVDDKRVDVDILFASIDKDSCAASGTFTNLRKDTSILLPSCKITPKDVSVIERWGVWQPADNNIDTCDRQILGNALKKVRLFLTYWADKIIQAIAGTERKFQQRYMPLSTTFSKQAIFTRPAKWMTSMKARSKRQKATHWIPAGDTAFAGCVLQIAIKFGKGKEDNKKRSERKKFIHTCSQFVAEFIFTKYPPLYTAYVHSVGDGEQDSFTVKVPGGPLVSYLILLAVSLLARENVTFSIETYGTKGRSAFQRIPLSIKHCDDETFKTIADKVCGDILHASELTPLFSIPKFMEIIDKLISPTSRLVSVGVGTNCEALSQSSKKRALVESQIINSSDAIKRLHSMPSRQIYVSNDIGEYAYSAHPDDTSPQGSREPLNVKGLIDRVNGGKEGLTVSDDESSFFSVDLGEGETWDTDDDEPRIGNDVEGVEVTEMAKKKTDIELAVSASVSKVFSDQAPTNIKDQVRSAFIMTKAMSSMMVFPLFHGIMPPEMFKICFKSGLDTERFCRWNPNMKSSFSDDLKRVLRVQMYDPCINAGVSGEKGKNKASHLAMNMAAAVGQSTEESRGFLNLDTFIKNNEKFFTNLKKFRMSIEKSRLNPVGRIEITTRVDERRSETFSYERNFIPSVKGLINVILTLYRYPEIYFKGYEVGPYLTLHELMGRALHGLSNEVISLLSHTTIGNVHTTDIPGCFNEALLLKTMGCRSNIAVFNNGRLAHRRPYSMSDTTAHALRRLMLPPSSMAIKSTASLIQIAGKDNVKKLFNELGILKTVEDHSRNVRRAVETLYCPIQIGRNLGATIFTPKATPDHTIACKYCHRFFLLTDRRLSEKFPHHPCLIRERAPNLATDTLTMTSKEWLKHLSECIAMLSNQDQISCYNHLFRKKAIDEKIANLLIAGAAGCGKTTVVEVIIKIIATNKGFNSMIIVSFTHTATDLIGGETLHKVAHLGIMGPDILRYVHGDSDESLLSRVERFIQDRFLRNADPAISLLQIRQGQYLILDEFGDMYVALAKFLNLLFQIIRGIQEPYGGLICIWSGDYFQTSIIRNKEFKKLLDDAAKKEKEKGIPNAKSKFRDSDYLPFYTSPDFLDWGFVCILFDPKTPNYRFKDCPKWGEFLALLRIGRSTESLLKWFNEERQETLVPLACRDLLQGADLLAIDYNYIDHNESYKKYRENNLFGAVSYEQFRDQVKSGHHKWNTLVKNKLYDKSLGVLSPYRMNLGFDVGCVASNKQPSFLSSLKLIPTGVFFEPRYIVSQHKQKTQMDNILNQVSSKENREPEFTHNCSFELKTCTGQAPSGDYLSQNDLKSMYDRSQEKREVESKFNEVFQCSSGDTFQLTSSLAGVYLGTNDLVTIKSINTSDPFNPTLLVDVHQQGQCKQVSERTIEPVRFEIRMPIAGDMDRMMYITQFPLTRAYSTTTLKTRGQTLDLVAVSLTMKLSQGEFYIMATRVRNIRHFWTNIPLPEDLKSPELYEIIRPNRFAKVFHEYLVSKRSQHPKFTIDKYVVDGKEYAYMSPSV